MKKPHGTVLFGAGICISFLIWMLLRLGSAKELSRTEDSTDQPVSSIPEQSESSPEAIFSNKSPLKRPQRTCQTIKELQDFGYQIAADRIGRTTAEGNVTIRSPEGDCNYTCDDFTISADGLKITLQGRISMDFAGDTLTSVDEHALIKVKIDGSLVEQPGVWRRTKNPIIGDAQTK